MSVHEFIGKCSQCGKKKQRVRKVRGTQLCRGCGAKLKTYANIKAFLGRTPMKEELQGRG